MQDKRNASVQRGGPSRANGGGRDHSHCCPKDGSAEGGEWLNSCP
jgi:hypothetical protein